MDPEEMRKRTKEFGLRVIRLVGVLPNTLVGRATGGQLIRSGTSVGANYRAVCRSRTKAEFIAKLGVVIEEADESAFWMELITDAGLMKAEKVDQLKAEAEEITRIMVKSRWTARRNRSRQGG